MDESTKEITDPDVIEAIEIVAKEDPDGLVEPVNVVEAARDPQSPLHRYFEWDDTAAAQAYRLVQARKLIARVRVVVVDHGPSMVNVSIVSPSGEPRRGYLPITRVASDPDLCAQAMADARRGIAAYRVRLSAFEQARDVVAHLDQALGKLAA